MGNIKEEISMDHEKNVMVGGIGKIGGFTEQKAFDTRVGVVPGKFNAMDIARFDVTKFGVDFAAGEEAKRIAERMKVTGKMSLSMIDKFPQVLGAFPIIGDQAVAGIFAGVANAAYAPAVDKKAEGNYYFIDSYLSFCKLIDEAPLTPVFWIENIGSGDIFFGPNPLKPGMKIEMRVSTDKKMTPGECIDKAYGKPMHEILTLLKHGIFKDDVDRLVVYAALVQGKRYNTADMCNMWVAMGGRSPMESDEPEKLSVEHLLGAVVMNDFISSKVVSYDTEALRTLYNRCMKVAGHKNPMAYFDYLEAVDELNEKKRLVQKLKNDLNK